MSTDLMDSRIAKLCSLCRNYIADLSKKRKELAEISQAIIDSQRENSDNANTELRKTKLLVASARYRALCESFGRLRSALTQLIRTASQMVEHATRDDLDGLELQILLADLEANLEQTDVLIDQLGSLPQL